MAVEQPPVEDLRDLLKECTAHVVGESTRGSGFFLDECHVLTCAHVVKGAGSATVQASGTSEARDAEVIEYIEEVTRDLALLEVAWRDDDPRPPGVVMDKAMADSIPYHAVGFPKAEMAGAAGPEIAAIEYRGYPRRSIDSGSAQLLVLEAGQERVTSGLSGGPVLSAHSGAVVAMIQYSRDTERDGGGGAIPIVRAAQELELVREYIDKPPPAARRWRDCLGRDAWVRLGKTWGWERQIDIWIEGGPCKWTVRIDPDDDAPRDVTVKDLPDDVTDALFRWAQRGSLRDEEQVHFVGRLLSRAIFPVPGVERLVSERLEDKLLIRLRFDPSSALFNVPWEFMSLEVDGKDRQIAAEPGIELVRVAKHPSGEKAWTPPAIGGARVLGVVVQPDAWVKEMPTMLGPEPVLWPEPAEVEDRLLKALATAPQIHGSTLMNPTEAQLKAYVANESFDIVHYIGFGQVENGEPSIGLSNGFGSVRFVEIADVVGPLTSKARLLVIELAIPRYGVEREPVLPRDYLSALENTVNAVVFTRLPVHPRQFSVFNESLYQQLGMGATVEAAVQHARWTLATDKTLADAGCFGWFALLTGEISGNRIVQPASGGQALRTTRQPTSFPAMPTEEPAGAPPTERQFTFGQPETV